MARILSLLLAAAALHCCMAYHASQFVSSPWMGKQSVFAQRNTVSRLRGGGADTKMGVVVTTERAGDGKNFPKKGDMVTVDYRGTLAANGKQFDASYDRNTPFKFQIGVGQVIKGWDEGVMKMSLGEKGYPPVIPPSSELIFEVELHGINNQKA